MAKRIQRKRTKGWKMPPNTVYVGRPTFYGNDTVVGEINLSTGKRYTAEEAVASYEGQLRQWAALIGHENFFTHYIEPLRGKNLACWCPLDQPCHADVLLKLASGEVI